MQSATQTVKKAHRPRRKRRSHYHTGTYVSIKTGQECSYRSGWELSFMQWLDVSPDVKTFGYECMKIPYVSSKRSGKTRNYIPDFLVEFTDGRKVLVEIKPAKRVSNANVKKKLAAAEVWCSLNDTTLQVITEVDLKLMGLL